METLDHADYHVWLLFGDLPPYVEKENKPSEFLQTFLLMPTVGLKPRPPVQQASALSIAPLPLSSPI